MTITIVSCLMVFKLHIISSLYIQIILNVPSLSQIIILQPVFPQSTRPKHKPNESQSQSQRSDQASNLRRFTAWLFSGDDARLQTYTATTFSQAVDRQEDVRLDSPLVS